MDRIAGHYYVGDHYHERSEAHEGINLSNEQISSGLVLPTAPVTTDPYRPAVGLTSSYDTPLVVKSGEDLPTGKKSCKCEWYDTNPRCVQGARERGPTCRDHVSPGKA